MSTTPDLYRGGGHRRGVVVGGRYEIRRKLGSGSMGTVYLASDGSSADPVALKVIRVERLISGAVARIQKEFKAFAALEHPQIAKAYDFGYTDGSGIPFYTREYVDGVPLPPGPPPRDASPAEYLGPLLDLLDAVSYLHEHGILHLDIHAGNLLVASRRERGSVLIDFGLLPPEGGARFSVADGLSALPPEMIGRGTVTARSDLFLVGRLLHYRMTGQTEGEVRLPREIPGWGPRLTLDLERIIAKALQVSPEQRFQSAAEFLAALSGALGERRPRLGGESPRDVILGRDRELNVIEETLRAVLAGGSGVLWFAGRSGLGKTRLLRETRQRAQLRGLPVTLVEFASDPGCGPALLTTLRAQGAGGRRAPAHDWLEPVEIRHGGTPEERARRAAEAYFSEGGNPLVLLLDDLDRADRESWSLVDALVLECLRRKRQGLQGRGLGVIVTGSLRAVSDTTSGALSGLLAGGDRELLHQLKPLPASESRRLVRTLVKPLVPTDELLDQAAGRADGIPLYLRQVAMALKLEWGESGVIPPAVQLPVIAFRDAPASSDVRSPFSRQGSREASPEDFAIVEALAVLERPARRKEIEAAVEGEVEGGRASLSRALRQLVRLEFVWASGQGGARRYRLSEPETAQQVALGVPDERVREMHRRVAKCLQSEKHPSPVDQENLVRHLLALERLREAQEVASAAAGRWRESGSYDRAIRLLQNVSAGETDARRRLKFAEEISRLCGESGDHQRGIAVMEPFVADAPGGLTDRDRVRASRRLGVHCHRAGAVEKALTVFERTRGKADPVEDLEDLIFIDSELGEVHIFLGRYGEAEEACQRGLERLDELRADDTFRQRMEVVLRASIGHLKLRRMSLAAARDDLLAASRLAERHGTTAERASILNNLAITANQLNEFKEAREHFEQAEQLLLKSGDRSIIEIATNLAVIAAKTGDRDEAHLHVERASKMSERYPGRRVEFFVAYSRGIVHQMFGEVDAAIGALEESLVLGRHLGDAFLVSFGEVYLAEALLAAGRYSASWRQLRSTLRRAERGGPTVLLRMAHSRLLLVEAIFGRRRPAARSRRFLRDRERTGVTLLESWSDLFVGLADVLCGSRPEVSFDAIRRTFSRLGVPFGQRFARLGALVEALFTGDGERIRERLDEVGDDGSRCRHALLAVAEPLARAEAHFALDELAPAENWLRVANGAIVGSPFLELDWRIELLRAKVAVAARKSRDARRHLHRVVHTRDLLLQLVPAKARERFLAHARFDALREGILPIGRSPRLEYTTERLKRTARYEGIVGGSSAMIRLFQVIEELRDQEIPVLISGETGTGKELVAKAIHSRSPRHKRAFQTLHCASLPEHLFESELFGYEAGAFTGAVEDQAGLLESLDGGTIVLDEIGELAIGLQSRLLQVLDSGHVRRLGSVTRKRLDVRFLVSTSRDLSREVAAGRFRADLYYRLRGVEILLPPLRERRDDLADLARFFVERHASQLERPVPQIAGDALELLASHGWPGNVRELETVLLRSIVNLAESETIRARDVEPFLEARGSALFDRDLLESRDIHDLKLSLEREYLTHLFRRTRGNAPKMMASLGVKRTQLYAWFQRLGIDVRELRRRL